MPGRLPTSSDFPSSLELAIIPPPSSTPRYTNVLILLHGLGDTLHSFSQLGKQLNLPETTCISLQGPMPMPFDIGGFHWGNDIIFSQSSHALDMDVDAGFSKSVAIIREKVIENGLIKHCGYSPREIMLFGFGQGGMAALGAAASIADELAGVVTTGGPFPPSAIKDAASTSTPVLLLGGASNTIVTRQKVDETKAIFKSMEYHKFSRSGDGMPTNRDEMLPVMRFFAHRLRSQSGVPEGSHEIG